MQKVTQIIFPNHPQFDPLAAYYVLLKYGASQYEGLRDAAIAVWPYSQGATEAQRSEWREKGIIAIDVGEGEFDHHNKPGATAVSLVAKHLGVYENPELQLLLEFAWEDDAHGLHNKYGELPYIIKALYRAGKKDHDVIMMTVMMLDALQQKEQYWRVEAAKVFADTARIERVKHGKRTVKLAVIESNDQDIANYARQQEGMDMVVQRNASGHTHVFTKKSTRINIAPMVEHIRRRELELRDAPPEKFPSDLHRTGRHNFVPEWYYHPALNAMFNGSFALKETPPTRIPLEEVVAIVRSVLTGG